MVAISKEEKEVIREKLPHAHIARTMKADSKRHHYYVEESRAAMRLLQRLRNQKQNCK